MKTIKIIGILNDSKTPNPVLGVFFSASFSTYSNRKW